MMAGMGVKPAKEAAPAMMSLTRRQADCLALIERAAKRGDPMPTYEELRAALGLVSRSNVVSFMRALERRGHIRRVARAWRAVELVSGCCPHCGKIAGSRACLEAAAEKTSARKTGAQKNGIPA